MFDVICINNNLEVFLTIGKRYRVTQLAVSNKNNKLYRILDDSLINRHYLYTYFITVDENRDKIIDELLCG